jgi:uncharacterized protein with FMN-binding domain
VRTRATLTGIFASVSVIVIGWQFGAAAISTATLASQASATAGSATAPTAAGTASGSSSSGTASTASGKKDGTFTGASQDTPFGSVQVKIVTAGGKITDVVPLQLTDAGGRSVEISNYATPILRSEVIQAQSAKVSGVSGATYTSEGYLSSVQSALDQAGF